MGIVVGPHTYTFIVTKEILIPLLAGIVSSVQVLGLRQVVLLIA